MVRLFKSLAIVAYVAVLSVGCATRPQTLTVENPNFRLRNTEPEDVVLLVEGEPGQRFSGDLSLDGKPVEINGETPAEIELRAQVITGTIRKEGGRGNISFDIINGEPKRSNSFGALKLRGDQVRFGYHDGAAESIFWN